MIDSRDECLSPLPLLRVVDWGILGVLLVAPLFMGGRHPLGKLVFASTVWVTAAAWLAAQWFQRDAKWSWSGAEVLLLLATILVAAQIAPLPRSLQPWLAPAQSTLLPCWSVGPAEPNLLGRWQSVSLTPEQTRQGLCMLIAYGVLFLIAFQRMRSIEDVERLLKWIAVASVAMALLGLVQFLLSNGKFLWIYEHPSRNTRYTVKGTFANQNHFAHFLALGLGPLIWWLESLAKQRRARGYQFFTSRQSDRPSTLMPVMLSVGLGAVTLAGVLTFSRGGLLIMALAALVAVSIHAAHGLVDRQSACRAAALLIVLAMALGIHGHQRLMARLAGITTGSLDQIDQAGARRKIWTAAVAAIPHFAVMGAGVGSHRDVYPTYMRDWSEITYTHAESGYLQVLLETGVPGFVLLLGGISLSGYWILATLRSSSSPRITACAAGVAAAWVVSVMHSLVDFVWYIPACMSCAVLLMAAAARLKRLATDTPLKHRTFPLVRFTTGLGMLTVAGTAALAVPLQLRPALAARHWENYLSLSFTVQDAAKDPLRVVGRSGPASPGQPDAATLAAMALHLEAAVARDPYDARARLQLATNCLRRFEACQQLADNPMSLASIREAAVASRFPSKKDQDRWLATATGEHRGYLQQALEHANRAVRLCPLEGTAYLYLAELAFLQGRDSARDRFITQALAVRPYDGVVLYTAGYEAMRDGDVPRASDYYRRSFQQGPETQGLIIESLAPYVLPEVFVEFFAPDMTGLGKLFEYYRAAEQREAAQLIGQHYVRSLETQAQMSSGSVAAGYWNAAQEVHDYLRDVPQALAAARHAVAAKPEDFHLRFQLATQLRQAGALAEALQEFRWCQRRRPDDRTVRARLAEVETHLTP